MAKQPNIDTSSPYRRRKLVQNIVGMVNDASPKERAESANWYAKVHEATVKGVRGTGTSVMHGAGLVAAVSPNMDWENRNIDALGELHAIKSGQWADIHKGDTSALQGTSIHAAPVANLIKAHRILNGEHPDDVLPRRTAPKTNSFAHNIADLDSPYTTVDGRAHDIAANRMQRWEENRGIGSAALPSGKLTRYEHFSDAHDRAADVINDQHGTNYKGSQIQAIAWEHAKHLERSGLTQKGQPRKQGPARRGQPYFGPGGLQSTL